MVNRTVNLKVGQHGKLWGCETEKLTNLRRQLFARTLDEPMFYG
jgi:hypothetical protein